MKQEKSIKWNVIGIIATVVVSALMILLMPFFWKWYEAQLNEDCKDVRTNFSIVLCFCSIASICYNTIIISNKSYK